MTLESNRTEEALRHLRSLKPYDGWSADTYIDSKAEKRVMLCRRNAPLSKSGYTSIAFDKNTTKCVVGITTDIGKSGKSSFHRGVVLVEKDGTVARDQREVRVALPNIVSPSSAGEGNKKEQELNKAKEQNRKDRERARQAVERREREGSGSTATATATGNNMDMMGKMSDQDSAELAKLGLYFIGIVTVLRILSSFYFLFNIILLPMVILTAINNCPKNESFDTKKELKRVLRGQHLPEGHQAKPNDDWLSQSIARLAASVTAEAATALGHEVSFMNIAGVCTFATVNVPVMNMEFYWIGVFGTWKYLLKRGTPVAVTQQ